MAFRSDRKSSWRRYHASEEMNSIGVPERWQKGARCESGTIFSRSPAASKSSRTRARASSTGSPRYGPAAAGLRRREGRLARGAPEVRTFPTVKQPAGPQFKEDGLAERTVFVGIREVQVPQVRGQARTRREVEEPLSDCLDLLSTFEDERLAVPLVEGLPGLLLHGALDVDAVPVEAEWKQDRLAGHPLGAGEHVDHRVRHDGPDVPRAARVRGRRVNRVDGLARLRGEPGEGRLRPPGLPDPLLKARVSRRLPHARRSP